MAGNELGVAMQGIGGGLSTQGACSKVGLLARLIALINATKDSSIGKILLQIACRGDLKMVDYRGALSRDEQYACILLKSLKLLSTRCSLQLQ